MHRFVAFALGLVACAGAAYGNGADSSIRAFGRIASVGKQYDPLCPCGFGIQLINEIGDTLSVSIGPSIDRPHGGFRVGAIRPADAAAVIVPHGSAEESALAAEIWRYLDTHLLLSQISHRARPAGYADIHTSDDRDLGLLTVINEWEAYVQAQRWLDNNVSREEQDRIFSLSYENLQSDFEREVFENVCLCQGRTFFWGPYSSADSTRQQVGGCR